MIGEVVYLPETASLLRADLRRIDHDYETRTTNMKTWRALKAHVTRRISYALMARLLGVQRIVDDYNFICAGLAELAERSKVKELSDRDFKKQMGLGKAWARLAAPYKVAVRQFDLPELPMPSSKALAALIRGEVEKPKTGGPAKSVFERQWQAAHKAWATRRARTAAVSRTVQ